MESTETKTASIVQPQLPSVAESHECHSDCSAVLRQVSEFSEQADVECESWADSLPSRIQLLRQKRRTSAKYRREIENDLYDWLTASTSDGLVVIDSRQDIGEAQLTKIASWVVGVTDRRVREPILKRLHVASMAMSDHERSEFLETVQCQLIRIIRVVPLRETAALSSILALVSWQAGDEVMVQAAVISGGSQDPDNVLLRLVASACNSGLPTSAWADVMDEYSLTKLRSG